MKRIMKLVYFLVPTILLFGLIAWRINVKNKETADRNKAAAARKTASPNVTVVQAHIEDIVRTYEAVGSVESPFNVKLAPKVAGRIDFLQVREGDHVTLGQVLARIDASELEATLAQQRGNLAEAQQRLAQAQLTTNATNVGVTSQILVQKATVASNRADYDQQRANYSAQVAAANAAVTDAQGRETTARSAIENANANLRSAQANLSNAQAKLNRTLDLYKQGFVAAQDVDDAKTTVEVQRGAVDVAQGQLSGARAALGSAQAQVKSAQEQASIVVTKGKADIEAARQKVAQAQAGLQLANANTSQSAAYLANISALKSAVAAAQATVNNAQAQIANTELRSTIDGYVTQRLADPGATVSAGTPIVAIQSLRQVYITTSIPEEFSRNIRLGQVATAVFDGLPGVKRSGKIAQINPAADPLSRQFTVRLLLDNAGTQLRPGMFTRVTFVTERVPGALVVPREAVKTDKKSGEKVVTSVDADNIAHVRPVKTGATDGAIIQVTSGLSAGEKVVTLSLVPVKEGQKVVAGDIAVSSSNTGNAGKNGGETSR